MQTLGSPLTRRGFLGKGAAAGLLAVLPGSGIRVSALTQQSQPTQARNVLFLVADGMNIGTLSAAHQLELQMGRPGTAWLDLYAQKQVPLVRALMETSSASSAVTDSAAAGSAWGIGEKINNRALNITPDGKQPEPILVKAKRAGKKTALVTTTRATHATPASFITNVAHRNMEDVIAEQYLEREVDILLGGGAEYFDPNLRKDGKDIYTAFRQKGYTISKDRSMLLRTNGDKLLGIFCQDHIPYAIDRQADPQLTRQIPSLPEMMELALSRIAGHSDGFFMQVEGGRIDHAGHANDPAAILREYMEFDQCIRIAVAFQKTAPDTLVIVTTDHGTGGMHFNGEGTDYQESAARLKLLSNVKMSYESFTQKHAEANNKNHMRRDLLAMLPPIGRHVEAIDAITETILTVMSQTKINQEAIGRILAPYSRQFSVSFTTQNHTGEMVELAAFGPGAEAIPAFLPNNHLHDALCEVARV